MNPTNGPNAPPVLSRDPTNQPTAGASRRATAAPSPERTLRRLFLTLFLRGRSSRGLRKESAPKSVGSKLGLTLAFYALFGLFALFFKGQPVFALSVYLHGMTFVFLGMFIAASAGEGGVGHPPAQAGNTPDVAAGEGRRPGRGFPLAGGRL